MSVEENKAIVLSFLKDVWGMGNLSLVDEIVADEHVHHFTLLDGFDAILTWPEPDSDAGVV